MRWWWSWESKKSLRERLAAREAWLKHAHEQAALWQKEYLTIWRELSHAHAALRRKGKALKELHKRVQYHKEKQP